MHGGDFETWVRCGLGRAALWLEEHDDAPQRDLLLSLLTVESAYDTQSEGSRARYLFELIRRTRRPDLYRRHLLDALRSTTGDGRDDGFRIHLAGWYADEGDEEFLELLYAKAREDQPCFDFLLQEIAGIDGVPGLLRVAESRPAGRKPVEPRRIEFVLESRDGEEAARAALAAARAEHSRFAALFPASEEKDDADRERRPAEGASFDEVRPLLGEAGNRYPLRHDLQVWGRHAPDREFERAAADLIARDDADGWEIVHGLTIFGWRAFPLAPSRLIEWAERPRPAGPFDTPAYLVPHLASRALEKLVHPDVRAHALRRIGAGARPGDAARILVRNFEPGDEAILLDLAERDLDPDEYHGLGFAVDDAAKKAGSVLVPALLAVYERGRCSFCREYVVTRLDELDAVPAGMREECRFDANRDLRAWASGVPDDPEFR